MAQPAKTVSVYRNTAKELCRELSAGMTALLDSGPSYGGYVAMKKAIVKKVIRQTWPKASARALSRIEVHTPVVAGYQKSNAADARRIEQVLTEVMGGGSVGAKAVKKKPLRVKRTQSTRGR